MKIGIVTWYKNGNYGGTLQAYALSHYLQTKGYKVEFINYSNNYSFKNRLLRFAKNIGMLLLFPKSHFSRKKIWKFVSDNLTETRLLTNRKDLINYSKKFDKVICGSDQIWSCAHGLDDFYFLTFVDKDKRISYAPSIGYNQLPHEYEKKFVDYIRDFNNISIREEEGKKIIYRLCNINATVVLDPTFLLSKEDWVKFSKNSKLNLKEKYILCYFLKDSKEYIEKVNYLKNKTKLKTIFISIEKNRTVPINYQMVTGVEDFVYLINNAEFILTDSFHGFAFSLNLNKKVAVFKRFEDNEPKGQNSRIYNLIQIAGLNKDIIINSNEELYKLYSKKMDFSKININLNKKRKESIYFLEKSIGGKK